METVLKLILFILFYLILVKIDIGIGMPEA